MTEPRKKILIIKPFIPYPPDMGTRILSFGLIRTLQTEFDVTVLTRCVNDEEFELARELERHCTRVVGVQAPNRKSLLHRIAYKLVYGLLSLTGRRSMKSLYDCPGPFVREARRLAAENFDVVVVEYWQTYRLLDVLPPDRTILLTHDVEMLVNRQNALLEKNLVRKIVKVRRWLVEQKEEIQAYTKARRILALTERDAAAIRRIRGRPAESANGANGGAGDGAADAVGVLPFGLDQNVYKAPDVERDPREVLFMGELRSAFNLDSFEYFVQKIYPHLDDAGDFSVTVVGGQLPPHLEFFRQDARVEVTGRVPDVLPYLARAACLVVPLRFGGGLRIRILEAMMARIPIVCSTVAIAGMDFEPEREYLLADTPKATAAQVRRLLDDPSLAREIAERASKAVRERYSTDVQDRKTLQIFRNYATR